MCKGTWNTWTTFSQRHIASQSPLVLFFLSCSWMFFEFFRCLPAFCFYRLPRGVNKKRDGRIKNVKSNVLLSRECKRKTMAGGEKGSTVMKKFGAREFNVLLMMVIIVLMPYYTVRQEHDCDDNILCFPPETLLIQLVNSVIQCTGISLTS